ncbi:MAG: carboxymuconolactone decarboxylase family protein [Burkholderiales bacterium]
MARIPYPDVDRPELAPMVARIKAERGGRLLNLYRMLLHSPPVASGWLALFTAIRQQGTVSGRLRELVILRIAALNGAEYEFKAHAPFALHEGLNQAQLDALAAGRAPEGLTEVDEAALAYAEAMTRTVRVPDPVFAAVRKHLGDREVLELTATIAGYNLVSRVLEALKIDHE